MSEITEPATRRQFKPHYVPIDAPRGHYQADLMDMSQVSSKKENKNMNFILVIMEIFSRYGFAYALKNKDTKTVLDAFKRWKSDVGTRPKPRPSGPILSIQTDDGSEFKGDVKRWFQDLDIHHRILDNKYAKNSNGMIERWIRTLRMYFRKIWVANNNLIWYPFLDGTVDLYNNTKHSRMKAKPIDVWNQKDIPVKQIYEQVDLKPGQRIRLAILKNKFDKASALPNWTREVYTIKTKNHNRYSLEEKDGYYPRWAMKLVGDTTIQIKMKSAINEGDDDVYKQHKKVRLEKRNTQELKREDIKPENERTYKLRLPKGQAEVEKIVGSKKDKKLRVRLYKVRWKGEPPESDTWLPARDIGDDILKEWRRS